MAIFVVGFSTTTFSSSSCSESELLLATIAMQNPFLGHSRKRVTAFLDDRNGKKIFISNMPRKKEEEATSEGTGDSSITASAGAYMCKYERTVTFTECIVDKMVDTTKVLAAYRENNEYQGLDDLDNKAKMISYAPVVMAKRNLPSPEEMREMERIKKARWRAKKKDKEAQVHQFDVPFAALPLMVWDQVSFCLLFYFK